MRWSAEELALLDIMALEGFAVALWLTWICDNHVELIRGRRIRPWCDNQAFVAAFNKGRSSHPVIERIIMQIKMLEALHSFRVWLRWVPTEQNEIADAASRAQWDRLFRELAAADHDSNGVFVQVSAELRTYRLSMSLTLCTLARSLRAMRLQPSTPTAPQ